MKKEEGRRKKEEGRRKDEEGKKKEKGRRKGNTRPVISYQLSVINY
jgi:hypothetical protein